MTREQRCKARHISEVSEAVDAFVHEPCRLSAQQTRTLLHELCVELGYCLAPYDFDAIVADLQRIRERLRNW